MPRPTTSLEILRELPELDEPVVAVVGHNPTIHCLSLDLVSELSLDGPHPALNAYPPGTLSIIELPIEQLVEDLGFARGASGAAALSGAQPTRSTAASPWPPPPQRATAATPPPRRLSS